MVSGDVVVNVTLPATSPRFPKIGSVLNEAFHDVDETLRSAPKSNGDVGTEPLPRSIERRSVSSVSRFRSEVSVKLYFPLLEGMKPSKEERTDHSDFAFSRDQST